MEDTRHGTVGEAIKFVLLEPVMIAAKHPPQVLLSALTVTMMAAFISADGIVNPYIAGIAAVGVEWAFLRGLADDARAQSVWGGLLTWTTGIVGALWGVLWVLTAMGALSEKSSLGWLIVIAIAHAAPIPLISTFAAMAHRNAARVDNEKQREVESEDARLAREAKIKRQQIELEDEEKRRELERWKAGQLAKAEIKTAGRTLRTAAMEREGVRVSVRTSDSPIGFRASGTHVGQSSDTSIGQSSDSYVGQSDTQSDSKRDVALRTVRENPGANRTHLANELGVARSTVMKWIADARDAGEL